MSTLTYDFRGATVLVTGGSQGIGRATAGAFARAGATVAICARTAADVRQAEREITARGGGRCWGFVADLADPAAPARLYREVEAAAGPLDILVNNAAAQGNFPFPAMSLETWAWMVQVNLHAPFELARLLARSAQARQEPAAIVNVLTDQIIRHAKGRVGYGSTKMGLAGLTRSLALELIEHRIRVNAVAPAFVDVTRVRTQFGDLEDRLAAAPLGRFIAPDEVASAVLFLASDAATAITGVILPVDGAHSVDGTWVRTR